MFGPQDAGWALDIIRSICAFIDKLVYQGVELVLQGIFDLASLKTSSGLLNDINVKIYVLVGIIMAFKLSFSFIQYIVNPDQMMDKGERGVSNLFLRLFIMLLLLVTLPSILFGGTGSKGLLTEAQEIILPMIPNLLMNDGERVAPPRETAKDAAKEMTLAALSAFYFQPEELKDKCEAPPIESLDDFTRTVNARCNFLGKQYQFTYVIFANFIVGLLLLLMFLDISIDVAKRVFKLLILEVLAPIPIISYIDPKSSKDGAFAKWVKSLTTTFLSLFLRIGIIYLMLFFISKLVQNGLFENFPEEGFLRRAYLTIFLILGLIYFAKEAPKFIQDSLGLKDDGGGKFGLGTVAALGGTLGAGVTAARASKMSDQAHGDGREEKGINKAKHVMAGLFGGAAGLGAGMYAAGDKNKAGDVNKAMRDRNARILAQAAAGSTFSGRLASRAAGSFGIETSAQKLEREVAGAEANHSLLKETLEHADKELVKKDNVYGAFQTQFSGHKFNYKDVEARFNASSPSATTFDIVDEHGTTFTMNKVDYQKESGVFKSNNAADYIQKYGFGSAAPDAKLVAILTEVEKSGLTVEDGGRTRKLDRRELSGADARKLVKSKSDGMELDIRAKKAELTRAKQDDRFSQKK